MNHRFILLLVAVLFAGQVGAQQALTNQSYLPGPVGTSLTLSQTSIPTSANQASVKGEELHGIFPACPLQLKLHWK